MNQNEITRRKLLVATGATVALGVAANPLLASSGGSEIEGWERQIGRRFNIQGSRTKLTLVAVLPMTAPDPDRPADFREQFTLIFKTFGPARPFEQGCYTIWGRGIATQELFLNETMALEYSMQPVVQAVFG